MNEEKLSGSVQKVKKYLDSKQIPCEFRTLSESTRTAQMAADVLGITPSEIASSLIFCDEADGSLILIVASGGHRVDLDKFYQATGRKLTKASGKDIKNQTGFAIGGVPPIAHDSPLPTYLDNALREFPMVWAAAGSPFAVFGITPDNLEKLTQGIWLDVGE